jgi:mono/diheme cytochrome c family protein
VKKSALIIGLPAVMGISVLAQNKAVTTKLPAKPSGTTLQAQIKSGKKIYTKYCLSCHQADGGGVQNMNPPLAGTTYVLGVKDTVIRIVLTGFKAAVAINGQTYSNTMASFSFLKDKEVADVLSYVRNSFGNKACAVSASEVAAARLALNNGK